MMITERQRPAMPRTPLRADDDLMALVMGGLWPAEAGLETLLDRIEAREMAR